MSIETSKIIIDDNLVMDVNTGIIGANISSTKTESSPVFPAEDLMKELDKIEEAIEDIQSSFDYNTISRLSQPNREGIYRNMGLLTNIVLGVMLALLFIILMM